MVTLKGLATASSGLQHRIFWFAWEAQTSGFNPAEGKATSANVLSYPDRSAVLGKRFNVNISLCMTLWQAVGEGHSIVLISRDI